MPSHKIHDVITKLQSDLTLTYGSIIDNEYHDTLMNSICQKNPQFCPPSNRWEKHFIPILSAIFGLTSTGLAIANSIHLGHLDEKFNAVQMRLVSQGSMQATQETVKQLTIANEHVYQFMSHAIQEITEMIE